MFQTKIYLTFSFNCSINLPYLGATTEQAILIFDVFNGFVKLGEKRLKGF